MYAFQRHMSAWGPGADLLKPPTQAPFQVRQGKETPPTLQEETICLCIFVPSFFQDAVVGIASKVGVHTLYRVWESSGGATDNAFVASVGFFPRWPT